MKIAALSYGAAGAAYLCLAAALVTGWRARLPGSMLLPALLMSALWCGLVSLRCVEPAVPLPLVLGLEIARDGAWLIFLLRILSNSGRQSEPRWLRVSICALIAGALVAVSGIGLLHELGRIAYSPMDLLQPAGLTLAIVGFILIDHAYRNTRPGEVWAAKFLWLGVGGLFVYDLLLYAVSLMYGEVPLLLWETRGAAMTLLAGVMSLGLARLGTRPAAQFLSRKLVFYTTGVTTAGVYLLAMALCGYYLRIVGGTWGEFAQSIFLFGAMLLLVMLAFSGQARAWLRVVVAKHLSAYKYDYRAEWLRLARTVDAADNERPLAERVIGAVAQLVNADAGGLWVLEDGSFVPVGGDLAGPDSHTEPAESEFARALLDREWIVDLQPGAGHRQDQPVAPPAWLAALPKARFIVPLLRERRLVGFLVIAQPLVAHDLNWEDIDLLRIAGRQVASYIALDQAAQQLARARQFEAFNRFVAFIMHDLKNLIAQQQLVVENAARHKDKPEFVDDAIATIDNSVQRMSRMLEQLRRGESGMGARRVNLAQLCSDVAHRCRGREPRPELDVGDSTLEVLLSPERFANVLENVVRNAQDATPACGSVRIAVSRGSRRAVVEIADSGKGMDALFVRERLFRPFDTTKGSQGMGIGAYQAREFVRALGGQVQVQSEPGKGTRFVIELPALDAAAG